MSTDLRDDGDFIDPTYCYRSLTAAIDDLRSPLRRYLSATFPHTRPSTTAYRKASGPLLVPGNAANPGTVGTAFDYLARLTLRPGEGLAPAYAGVQGLPGAVATLDDVVARGTLAQQQGEPPSEALARACWALALCTEIYRSGPLPGHPVVALVQSGRFTADTLLELAPADAICSAHRAAGCCPSRVVSASVGQRSVTLSGAAVRGVRTLPGGRRSDCCRDADRAQGPAGLLAEGGAG